MGRIDDALRRANLDAAQGTGAESTGPAATPWQVEPQERAEGPATREPVAIELNAAPPADAPEPEHRSRRSRLPGFDAAALERLVTWKDAGPLLIEQYRSFAATLHRAQAERQIKSLIVTSPAPGDGKSNVAVNLALTLSGSYHRRVLLVDADLRRPTLHLLFRVPNARGLSEALRGTADGKVATVQINESLTLLPAGRAEANPLGGLSSERMKHIVADAASQFDWVIIDSPPVGILADAHLVSETVDSAILVVRAGATHFPDLQAAADTLGHDRILGVVLNAVEPGEIRGQGYYSHYYGREDRH
jgi:protein-tyrosine kinase